MKLLKTNLKNGFSISADSRVYICEENYISFHVKVRRGFIECHIDHYRESRESNVDFIFYKKLKTVEDAEEFITEFNSYSDWWKYGRKCECEFNNLKIKFKEVIEEINRMIGSK